MLRLADLGKTLIVTSHILPELSRICDTVAIMTYGKLRAFGPLSDVMRQISQQRIIEIQLVESNQLEQAAAQVRSFVAPATEVTISKTESVVRFPTAKSEKELSSLLAKLVDARIEIGQFREIQTDLEDAFLTITRGDRQKPVGQDNPDVQKQIVQKAVLPVRGDRS